jgi:hypothetical protein
MSVNKAGFEILTLLVMRHYIFWDITTSISLKANLRFGGTFRLHFQVIRRETRTQHEAGIKQSSCSLFGIFFDLSNGGNMFVRNVD